MLKHILILSLSVLILPHSLLAAPGTEMEKEYQLVRTIAMRDSRVQSAYRDADRRLDAKIIQIDPALEDYVKAKQARREGTAPPKPEVPNKSLSKPFAKPVAKSAAKPAAGKNSHVVASGETLGGIAAKHRVSVAALKSTNRIQDERKLRVGQTLSIPSGKTAPQAKKEESVWSRLMR